MTRGLVEFDDLSSLSNLVQQLPGRAEETINQILHTDGVEIVAKEMTNLLPVSNRQKPHAKNSKWWTKETGNLEFVVKSRGGAASRKGSFGYLVFPDEGRGPSNPFEQDFSGRSLQRSTPKILEKLHGALNNLLGE